MKSSKIRKVKRFDNQSKTSSIDSKRSFEVSKDSEHQFYPVISSNPPIKHFLPPTDTPKPPKLVPQPPKLASQPPKLAPQPPKFLPGPSELVPQPSGLRQSSQYFKEIVSDSTDSSEDELPQSNHSNFQKELTEFFKFLVSNINLHSAQELTTKSQKLIEATPQSFQEFKTALQTSLKCSFCLGNSPQLNLECLHKYCHNCFFELLQKTTDGELCLTKYEKQTQSIKCGICFKAIREDLLKAQLPQEWEFHQIRALEREKQQLYRFEGLIQCLFCQQNKKATEYFQNDLCKHACKLCLLNNWTNGIKNCPVSYCNQPYEVFAEAINETTICASCQRKRYLIQDHMICIENNWLCIHCLSAHFSGQQLLNMSESQKNYLKPKVYFNCFNCKKTHSKDQLVVKLCCSREVCQDCQALQNSYSCMLCRAKFLPQTQKKLIEINNQLVSLAKAEIMLTD